MEGNIVVKEVRILETADDIQDRRDQVLSRYSQFRSDARLKRDKLEDSRRFQVGIGQIVLYIFLRMAVRENISILYIHQLFCNK